MALLGDLAGKYLGDWLEGFLFIQPSLSLFKVKSSLTNMPKFKKTCGNPFHKDWSDDTEEYILVNLKAEGLIELGNALRSKKEGTSGEKSYRGIENICTPCLKKLSKSKELAQYVPASHRLRITKQVDIVFNKPSYGLKRLQRRMLS